MMNTITSNCHGGIIDFVVTIESAYRGELECDAWQIGTGWLHEYSVGQGGYIFTVRALTYCDAKDIARYLRQHQFLPQTG